MKGASYDPEGCQSAYKYYMQVLPWRPLLSVPKMKKRRSWDNMRVRSRAYLDVRHTTKDAIPVSNRNSKTGREAEWTLRARCAGREPALAQPSACSSGLQWKAPGW